MSYKRYLKLSSCFSLLIIDSKFKIEGPEDRKRGDMEVDGDGGADAGRDGRLPGRPFNRNTFGLSFGLKNHLSFGLRFPTLRKSSKMG